MLIILIFILFEFFLFFQTKVFREYEVTKKSLVELSSEDKFMIQVKKFIFHFYFNFLLILNEILFQVVKNRTFVAKITNYELYGQFR